MANGISINIGLNHPSTLECCSSAKLEGCEEDARFMADIAGNHGFATTLLVGKDASRKNVLGALAGALRLRRDDILLLSFSGHGCQVTDWNNDEKQGGDEAWCLDDDLLIDDELSYCLAGFAEGVRIVVFSVCCFSGGIPGPMRDKIGGVAPAYAEAAASAQRGWANLSEERNLEIQRQFPLGDNVDIHASVLVLAACEEDKLAQPGPDLTLYTRVLSDVWNDGTDFTGTYLELHERIKAGVSKVNQNQIPQCIPMGRPHHTFPRERPFRI